MNKLFAELWKEETERGYFYYNIWGEVVENGLSLCVRVSGLVREREEREREREYLQSKTLRMFNCCPVLWLPGEQRAHPVREQCQIPLVHEIGAHVWDARHISVPAVFIFWLIQETTFPAKQSLKATFKGHVIKYILRLPSFLCPTPSGTCCLSLFFSFSITALLRHNSLTRQFTFLECTSQWFLAYSQSWATITTVSFGTFSSARKETPYSLAVAPHCLLTPSPRQPLIYFLSLWTRLLRTYHTDGLI